MTRRVGTVGLVMGILLIGPGSALAQDPEAEPAAPPPVEWDVETEVGASVFFGASDQTTIATELRLNRDSRLFEFRNESSFTYGEATDDEGESSVTSRTWQVAGNLDYRGFTWLNPYAFGSAFSSFEKRIHRRYKVGSGAKLSALDTDVTRLDLAAAVAVEQTISSEDGDGEKEWLGRWTGSARFRRSFSENRAVFETSLEYNPKFQKLDNFTLEAASSLAFRLSEIISLKLSLKDHYDNQAKSRGAPSNNDGRVLFSVLAAF